MQGLGLFTLEQFVYLQKSKGSQKGQLFTTGPGTYKIPSCQDIPVDFRVALLGRAPNPKAIFSSKVRIYAGGTGNFNSPVLHPNFFMLKCSLNLAIANFFEH